MQTRALKMHRKRLSLFSLRGICFFPQRQQQQQQEANGTLFLSQTHTERHE